MHNEGFFFQAFVYLVAAVLAVPVAKRLGLGSVLGYLLAGVAIGPFGLKLVGERGADVMHFAEFGVVMMLFLIGLELNPSLLWRMRGPILGLGGLQVTATTLVVTGLGLLFGLAWQTSLAVGLILALSSTAIVLQTLNEKALLKTQAGQFFISVGASIDFHLLMAHPWQILGLVAGLAGVKLVILFMLGRAFKMPASENFLFSFALAQGGEFAFVLLSFATQNRVLTTDVANPLVVAVALSMLLTPLLMIVNEKLVQPRFRTRDEEREPDEIDERENPVIIAGFGRFGQIVGRLLLVNGIKTTVLDHDPAQIEMLRKFGFKVFYGNASRVDLLHAAGAEQAKLFVLAIDERQQALATVETVRKHYPHLRILARAHDRVHAYELMKLGVECIERETFDAALATGEAALRALGFRAFAARRLALRFKLHDEAAVRATYELWGDEKAYMLESRKQMQTLEKVLKTDESQAEPASDSAWDTTEIRKNVQEGEF